MREKEAAVKTDQLLCFFQKKIEVNRFVLSFCTFMFGLYALHIMQEHLCHLEVPPFRII